MPEVKVFEIILERKNLKNLRGYVFLLVKININLRGP